MTSSLSVDSSDHGIAPLIWVVRSALLGILGMGLWVMVLMMVFFGYQISISNRIVPGVMIDGVDVGGLTLEQVRAQLGSTLDYPQQAIFTFVYQERVWQVSATELGVRLDLDRTLAQAFAVGHQDTPLLNLQEQVQAWARGVQVSPHYVFDQSATLAYLHGLLQEIGTPAVQPTLVFDGLAVQTTPAQMGIELETEAILNQITAQVQQFTAGAQIPLTVKEVQPQAVDLEATAAFLRTAVSAPLTLTAMDGNGQPLGEWHIQPEQIAPLLRITETVGEGGARTFGVEVDMDGFQEALRQLAPGLIVPGRNGRFHFDDANKQLVVIEPAVDARELDVDGTLARLEQAVFSLDQRIVPMVFTTTPPHYHNHLTAAELGITELVSESTSYYSGSTAARIQNIEVGTALFDGVIIAPQEVFSFNAILGELSYEQGFAEGAIIFGGRTVKGIGGGICQVSTTIFRTAFYGGFPIVERYSHGYRVYYYELGNWGPGLDAAIFTPSADFKFQNDTDYHILLEAEMLPEQDALTFRFYSTNPGRQVEVSQPIVRNVTQPTATIYEENPALSQGQQLQVDWSKEGGDVVVTRIIRDAFGNILEQRDFGTFYQPWSAVVQVAPGDSRLRNG
ncbi:MAG: VanW family protein [Phototrophicaceae bacterium]